MGRFTDAADKAADFTNQELATEIAAISALSRSEIEQLLPEKQDKEVFAQLMQAVESERSDDEKLAFLRGNLETAGRVVIKVLRALV
jgi:regulator of sirC expression with transglutaminase-like and TPR domain